MDREVREAAGRARAVRAAARAAEEETFRGHAAGAAAAVDRAALVAIVALGTRSGQIQGL